MLSAQVECLGNKSADLTWSDAATAPLCSGERQAFARPGQRDIGEASLLAQCLFIYLCWSVWGKRVARHHIIRAAELCSERKSRWSTFCWETSLDEVRSKDDGELQPLRLVNREERDRIKVGINIGGRRIVPRLTELLEVAHQEWGAIKLQQSAAGAHHIKEASDVANALIGLRSCFAGELGEQARLTQPAIEHLTTRPLHALLHDTGEAFKEPLGGLMPRPNRCEALPQREMIAARLPDRGGQDRGWHLEARLCDDQEEWCRGIWVGRMA